MEGAITIRAAETQDLDFVYNVVCTLENEVLDFEIFREIFQENISNSNIIYLLAEIQNEGIGFVSFHVQQLLHHCGAVGEIQEFFIFERYRGKGVGRQLFEKIMYLAEKSKLKSVEVTTNRKRAENVLIYENLGFSLSHHKFTIWNSH